MQSVSWPTGASEDGYVQQQQQVVLVSPVHSGQTRSMGGWREWEQLRLTGNVRNITVSDLRPADC